MLTPNADLAEQMQVVSGFLPVDMSSAANTGDYVSLKGYERCTILFFKNAGTAGDDPTLTVQQATAVAGTGAKDLAVIDTVYVKQDTVLTSEGTFTKTTQTAATSYTDATSAEDAAIWMIDIKAEDLDVDNGFDCINASVADVGTNAQIGALLYLLWPAKTAKATLVSAIAD